MVRGTHVALLKLLIRFKRVIRSMRVKNIEIIKTQRKTERIQITLIEVGDRDPGQLR